MRKLLLSVVVALAVGVVVLPAAAAQATLAPAEWTSNGVTLTGEQTITSTTTAASTGGTGRILATTSNGWTIACHLAIATGSSWVDAGGAGFVDNADIVFSDCVSNMCAGVTTASNSSISSQLSYDTATGAIVDVLSGISVTDNVPCVGNLTFAGSLETMATHDASACGGNGGVILEFLNSATGGSLSGPSGLTTRASGFQELCLDDGSDLDVEIP